jgi:hypothetical protein
MNWATLSAISRHGAIGIVVLAFAPLGHALKSRLLDDPLVGELRAERREL